MYGSEFGTDKIAHIFQQGYTYYKSYRRNLAKKAEPAEAVKRAIDWGNYPSVLFTALSFPAFIQTPISRLITPG
jgi:hypothetical protein